jgi:23S rRNA pseudouridine1911/1915/1917 synthase
VNESLEVLHIDGADAGKRIDVFVAAHRQVSRARAQKLLEHATLNGAPVKASHTLRPGDELALPELQPITDADGSELADIGRKLPSHLQPRIVHEDAHLVVIEKPRGIAVHPGAGERLPTVVDVLQAGGRTLSGVGPNERAGIVHRLDKETSGLMVVCKTDAAHWKLAEEFAERRISKKYAALVCGVPVPRGRIEAPIVRHPVNRKKMTIDPAGRPSITEFRVIRSWPKFALLEIDLLTGRTHQIRVHLTHLHHPVVVDAVYGGGLCRALQTAPGDAARIAIEALSGQALHATRLAFVHPITQEPVEFESPLPDDMRRIIEALEQGT